MNATVNEAWRREMIEKVFRAMTDCYDEAWDIGCWEHGTGQFFAERAVDTVLGWTPPAPTGEQ